MVAGLPITVQPINMFCTQLCMEGSAGKNRSHSGHPVLTAKENTNK